MATGRATGCGDSVGVYAEVPGILTDVSHGRDGVFNAGVGEGTVAAEAVFEADADKATLSEVLGLRLELSGGAVPPAAAEEEDGGAGLGVFPVG